MDTSSIRDISIHLDTVLLYDPSWRVKRTLRRDLDCGDPRRRRYREKLLASSIGGDPVRVCVGVIVDHTDLSSIASSTIMSLTEISIWHLVYVELIFGRPHAVKPDVSYDGSDAVLALRYGHHAHDERVGVGRRDGQETRATHQKHHQRRHSRTCADHGHRFARSCPKTAEIGAGRARGGRRRLSRRDRRGAAREERAARETRAMESDGRGIRSAVAAVQHPLCSSRCQAVALVPVVRQALRVRQFCHRSLTRLPNGFVG